MTGPPWFLQGDEPVEYCTTRAPLQASCVDFFAWLPPELVREQLRSLPVTVTLATASRGDGVTLATASRGDGAARLPEPLADLWCGPACPRRCGARCSVVRDAFACAVHAARLSAMLLRVRCTLLGCPRCFCVCGNARPCSARHGDAADERR